MVYIKEDSFLARIAAGKLKAQSVAMVIGNTIHLHNVTREVFLKDERWVRHEMAHIDQYKRYGLFRFLLLYTWYSMQYGYRNNPFEIEAREKEKGLR